MWIKGIMLAALGLSAGAAAAGGIFSFIIGLGVVSDLADRTHTGETDPAVRRCSRPWAGFLAQSGSYFRSRSRKETGLLPAFGIFGGIFVGCWAMALAEILNLFPILIRRARLKMCIKYIIVGIALGKVLARCSFFRSAGNWGRGISRNPPSPIKMINKGVDNLWINRNSRKRTGIM